LNQKINEIKVNIFDKFSFVMFYINYKNNIFRHMLIIFKDNLINLRLNYYYTNIISEIIPREFTNLIIRDKKITMYWECNTVINELNEITPKEENINNIITNFRKLLFKLLKYQKTKYIKYNSKC